MSKATGDNGSKARQGLTFEMLGRFTVRRVCDERKGVGTRHVEANKTTHEQ